MTTRVARGDASRRRAMASSSSSSSSDDLDFGGVGARASARTRIGAREDARDGDALFWGGALSEMPARRRRDDAGARAKKPRPSRSVSSSSSSASLRSSAAAVGGGSTLGGGVVARARSRKLERGDARRRREASDETHPSGRSRDGGASEAGNVDVSAHFVVVGERAVR
jgi:hypothetical protein